MAIKVFLSYKDRGGASETYLSLSILCFENASQILAELSEL